MATGHLSINGQTFELAHPHEQVQVNDIVQTISDGRDQILTITVGAERAALHVRAALVWAIAGWVIEPATTHVW